MKTDEGKYVDPGQPAGVQHDSETPVPQKPSFLFTTAALLVIVTLVFVIVRGYYGLAH